MTDAVEPARQHMKQEAAYELVDTERDDLLAVRAIAAIILVAERDAGLVEGEQPPVRNDDAMSVARDRRARPQGRRRAAWRRLPSVYCGPVRDDAGRPAARRAV